MALCALTLGLRNFPDFEGVNINSPSKTQNIYIRCASRSGVVVEEKTTTMDRSQSASFQQVEDWLRGLGLLQYAQSFYDNGYEDIETCKEINEEDLEVIGVKGERDRADIISSVQRLKLNVYFELETEPVEKKELEKFDPITLKSKLKDALKAKNVQLIEPPYYNPDGTFGDLYPLAITLAGELGTHFSDVLEALEQLRKRQLPVQTYDVMSNGGAAADGRGDEKDRSNTLLDPAEYLNCEMNEKNRGHSFSKYDTRVTKSTTDLTKDVNHERSQSSGSTNKYKVNNIPKGGNEKGKSRFSIFHRKETMKPKDRDKEKEKQMQFDFKADELPISQSELCDMMSKVKKNEMSQEEVLEAVKKRTSSAESRTSLESTVLNQNQKSMKKSTKVNKNMIKRTPSAHFYTKDDTPYTIPTPNEESVDKNRSASTLSDADGQIDSNKSSPELKPGLISKIRRSMRNEKKAGKVENDDGSHNNSLSPSESISSQENITISDASGKNSPEVKRNEGTMATQSSQPLPPNKPARSEASVKPVNNVYQHPTPIITAAVKGALPPVPPLKPKKDTKRNDNEWEVFGDDTPSTQSDSKYKDGSVHKITTDDKYGSISGIPGKGLKLDLSEAKLKSVPKAAPRIMKTSASSDEGSPISTKPAKPAKPNSPLSVRSAENKDDSTPVAPPRSKKQAAGKTQNSSPVITPVTPSQIDDIGEEMNDLIAGLDDRLNDIKDNYVDDSKLDMIRTQKKQLTNNVTKHEAIPPTTIANTTQPRVPSKKPSLPPAKPTALSKKPILPPRKPDTQPRKTSVDSVLPRKTSVDGGVPRKVSVDTSSGNTSLTGSANASASGSRSLSIHETSEQRLFYEEQTKQTDTLVEQVSEELEQIRKDSLSRNTTATSSSRNKESSRFKPLPLKRILQKKLQSEKVKIHEAPYTNEKGEWQIPQALVKRYSDELCQSVTTVVKSLETIRHEECTRSNKHVVPYKKNVGSSHPLPAKPSLDEWLVYVGLPMFVVDLKEVDVTTIEAVHKLKEKDFVQIGDFHETHVALLLALAKDHLEHNSIVYF